MNLSLTKQAAVAVRRLVSYMGAELRFLEGWFGFFLFNTYYQLYCI